MIGEKSTSELDYLSERRGQALFTVRRYQRVTLRNQFFDLVREQLIGGRRKGRRKKVGEG